MACVGRGQTQRANNKVYGWLKKKNSKAVSIRLIGNSHSKGNILTAETRAKMKAAKTGHKHSDEVKEKIRLSNIKTKSEKPTSWSNERKCAYSDRNK